MYGELGYKLVQHAKREQSLKDFPVYQTEIVRAITREVQDLDRDVSDILQPFHGSFDPAENPATACTLLVHHLCMRRNKRCLLAYHRVRAEKIVEMCWDGGDLQKQADDKGGAATHGGEVGIGGGGIAGEDANSSLSPEEDEYARQYGDMLAGFKGQWTDIDLTGSMEPPKDLFIDVRVLKDAGEIQTEYGADIYGCLPPSLHSAITLSKNSRFFVRQGDVERLIKQGFLQKLN